MSILVGKHTRVLVQGITGQEGSRAAREMRAYGTTVVAGVTPGKGGQTVEPEIPVYDSVAEALAAHPDITLSLVVVPPPFAADATIESLWHGITLVNVLTEKIPVADMARAVALAKARGARIVGPSSVGIITPGKAKVGAIGSSDVAARVFTPGPVGLISKSGGMTAELARILTEAGLGQSTALGIGGDVLLGTDFLDCARLFEEDPETRVLVIFGEVGGVAEELLAEAMERGEITKPVVALIAGDFGKLLPHGTILGHAGAIVSGGRGSVESKVHALRRAGAAIAKRPEDVARLARHALAPHQGPHVRHRANVAPVRGSAPRARGRVTT